MPGKRLLESIGGALAVVRAVLAVVALGLAVLWTAPGFAQTALLDGEEAEADAVVLPDPLTPEAVRELVSRLSDAEVRQLLLERLDAVASESAEDAQASRSFTAFLSENLYGVWLSVRGAVVSVPNLAGGVWTGLSNFAAPRGPAGMAEWVGILLAAIAAGLLVETVQNRIARPWRERVTGGSEQTLVRTLLVLGKRFMLDFGGIFVFLAVSGFVIHQFMPATPRFGREAAWALITQPIMFPRMAAALSWFLAAPTRSDLRLVRTDDATAQFFHRVFIALAFLMGFQAFILPFLASHGVPLGEVRLGFWTTLAFYGLLMWSVWKTRPAVTRMLIGPDDEATPAEVWVARIYPNLVLVLAGLNWTLTEMLVAARRFDLLGGQQQITLVLILFAPAFDTAIRGVVRHIVPPMKGSGEIAERAHRETKRALIRVGRVLVLGLILWITFRVWDLDVVDLAAAGTGFRFAVGLIDLMGVLAVGYLVWELVTLWINLKLAAEMTAAGIDLNEEEPGGGEGGGTGVSRLSTILPLMRWSLQALIAVMTLLIALGSIGIDITPLLAGAGIAGIAIGFGAQKLVTDIVSGVFFLIDDAFRTGEYVEIEGTLGTVEKISIRSLQLRHHRGAIHTIPFGEIPKLTNYSRDWVIMKLRFTVPFDTDLNKVKKLFKKIGAEMMEVPEFAQDLLQPFKSQGVLEVDDVGIVVRGKFMAKPGKQFTLRKEIYSRVQQAFDENGIQFARKEVRVRLEEPSSHPALSEEDRQAIGAAAAQAAEPAGDPGAALSRPGRPVDHSAAAPCLGRLSSDPPWAIRSGITPSSMPICMASLTRLKKPHRAVRRVSSKICSSEKCLRRSSKILSRMYCGFSVT